jgi:hypothetical protein
MKQLIVGIIIVGTLMWGGNNVLTGILESAQARTDHIQALMDDHMDAINSYK